MSEKTKSLRSRIDGKALQELKCKSLPSPVDALNLVNLADEVSYRWYGLLLVLIVLPLGVKPVWAGIHEHSLYGNKPADEIVIVRYSNHRTLLRIITSKYYTLLNRIRVKGVRYLEFSLTERYAGEKKIKRKGHFLFVLFNVQPHSKPSPFNEIKTILESGPARLLYASRETSPLSIFHTLEASDPNPTKYKEIAIFGIPDIESIVTFLSSERMQALLAATPELSLQIYRPIRTREAIPWTKRAVSS